MTETIANGYSFESTQREPSNEYQHDRVKLISTILCFLVHWMKVTSATGGLSDLPKKARWDIKDQFTHLYLEHTHDLAHMEIFG